MLHDWKRISLLGVVQKGLQKMSNGLKIVEFVAQKDDWHYFQQLVKLRGGA